MTRVHWFEDDTAENDRRREEYERKLAAWRSDPKTSRMISALHLREDEVRSLREAPIHRAHVEVCRRGTIIAIERQPEIWGFAITPRGIEVRAKLANAAWVAIVAIDGADIKEMNPLGLRVGEGPRELPPATSLGGGK